MIISKGIPALKLLQKLPKASTPNQLSVRNSSHNWYYRTGGAEPSKTTLYLAEIVQGVAWWWILWHCWTEPGHIFGEFEYPDASKWTDEELGIPSVD